MTFTQWPSKPLRSQQKISSRKSTLRTSSVSRTALGVRHPKFWGNDQTYFPGVDRIQPSWCYWKVSTYRWILNSSWWLYTATGQNKGGPPKAQPLSSKSDRFWKTRCWNVEGLTSTMFTFHLYIYISFRVQPQKNQLLCRCAMFFLMLMVACWKAAQIPHQHQLIWDPNHR